MLYAPRRSAAFLLTAVWLAQCSYAWSADPDVLRSFKHEIYGTFAGNDRGISVEHVQRFAGTLRTAGVPNDVHIYDAVEHAFWQFIEKDPELNTAPALDAWQRLKAYLARTLGKN